MSESKPDVRVRLKTEEFAGSDGASKGGQARPRHAPSLLKPGRVPETNGAGSGGWDAYRRWLTRVQSPDSSRTPLDASLYTWKGYRNWSDQVRRDWKNDD